MRAECLPADKVHEVAAIAERPVIMVGDGVNDAPVLAAADVGIAMGRGATAASESADAVILVDDISRTAKAVEIGRDTVRIALQSIWLGIIVSVALMLVAAFGVIPATIGALLQEVVDLAAILAALRAIGGRRGRGGGVGTPRPRVSPPANLPRPRALARPRGRVAGGPVMRLLAAEGRDCESLFVRFTNKRDRNGCIANPGSRPPPRAGAVPLFADRVLRASGKVLPEHARSHNRSLVLQTLYTQGAQSRADVARETGLTRVTVSDLVAELIGEGLVVELGQREDARPGKPATLIDVDRTGFHIVALDLSEHTRFRGAVLDLDGGIVAAGRGRARRRHRRARGRARARAPRRLLALTTARVLGIGVGSPGVVEPNGVVHSAPNLGWTDLPLQERLAAAFHLPVHVANDANVAVLAEHASAPGDLILVKVGHGVGAGLIVGGRPVLGAGSAAGEIGHVVVGTDGGPAARAASTAASRRGWPCRASPPSSDGSARRMPPASAREETLREAGRRLGIVLAPVVGALNLSEVVLSGPAELLDGPLIEATVETLRNRTMAEHHRDLRLRMTAQGQDIVLRGAAVMVLSGQLGVS